MEEKIKFWEKRYHLKNLKLAGYRGGYPIVQFDKEEDMSVLNMSKRQLDHVLRKAETYGGIELGVAYCLRNTAFIIVNNETIVICGHELVLDRVFESLF